MAKSHGGLLGKVKLVGLRRIALESSALAVLGASEVLCA
jgi:hypothetical protein